ncbi:MAG: hypothetical protein KTR13_05425 [Saprospiraceae bacterium]|nr:hypothetical protein [Saprospiraceae bacterium]
MMKQLIGFLLILGAFTSYGQLDSVKLQVLQEGEAKLQELGDTILTHQIFEKRQAANYAFIKQLTQTLKTENSYEYGFPNLRMVSIVNAPDNAFRVFTWQVQTKGELVRHYGAIQLNGEELQLIPLLDRSDDIANPLTHIGSNKEWVGALYYDILKETKGKKTYYFLLGLDINNPFSNKKLIDALQFTEDGQAVFGAAVFPAKNPRDLNARYILEYRGDASTSVKYNKKMRSIVFDHLIPLAERYEGAYAYYVPDGTYDALRWKQGQWIFERNIIETSFDNLEDLDQNKSKEGQSKSDEFYRPN